MAKQMLTTIDNPFNPFTHFDEWNAFDTSSGYHTLALLARMVITSDELSEADQALAIQDGVDRIAELNAVGVYRKVDDPSG